ncbi:hypothetical protein BC828DRAFT_410154 [Blastocladiella britannica]|nr:hypothetical protein BC828DRAFT_410154 [Blastocladiella britannica]
MATLPAYFAAFDAVVPSAPVLHMHNHIVDLIRQFGISHNSSTKMLVELPHRLAAKAPSKHVSRTDVLEFGALDVVLVYDAMVTQFVYNAVYDPGTLVRKSWGPVLQLILNLANASCSFVFTAPQDHPTDPGIAAVSSTTNVASHA